MAGIYPIISILYFKATFKENNPFYPTPLPPNLIKSNQDRENEEYKVKIILKYAEDKVYGGWKYIVKQKGYKYYQNKQLLEKNLRNLSELITEYQDRLGGIEPPKAKKGKKVKFKQKEIALAYSRNLKPRK